MTKKSQALPLNTIIIAIIVVVVLVILILVFTGRMGVFSREMRSCTQQGGECVKSEAVCKKLDGIVRSSGDCSDDSGGDTCCIYPPGKDKVAAERRTDMEEAPTDVPG
ncbi:hypothetical protein COV22_04220 [Candidatus Woesearchaeota archaeon CG10_big_fil_rev_8_21_14_0_10_47_5]|nr:MAG: hypothetical protein COV22_04220 [Candidatus Woesearchaeota archaeon CG10_big_fil_rev_8_21_14_0_10_47_5]HII30196.1 hypothetical protein [Candidatus Woesearchaeota archaeon]